MTLSTGQSNSSIPGRMRKRRRTRGITLIELILVMTVIATTLAMTAPSLRGFLRGREHLNAAQQILSLTRLARSRAITEARRYRMNFDLEAREYWLTAEELGSFKKFAEEQGRVFSISSRITTELMVADLDSSDEYVQFYPNGRTDVATIRLTDSGGDIVEIVCESPHEIFRIENSGKIDAD